MNNLIRFKNKMLIVLTFCVFMTFSMLVYVMKLTEKCGDPADEMCFHVSKSPVYKASYIFYKAHDNITQMSFQLLKPFTSPGSLSFNKTPTMRYYNKTVRTTRDVLKIVSVSNFSLGNETAKSRRDEPLNHSVSFKPALINGSTAGPVPSASPSARPFDSNALDTFVKKFHAGENDPRVQVYINRRKNLQRFCHKYFDANQILKMKKIKMNHILIDEKHKILYCYVPKVACTNWKRIFLVLTGKANNFSEVINLPSSKIHAKNLFKSLQNHTLAQVQKISEEYTKFIFVRHPFERLLSAYRNKLEQHYDSSKYFQARFGKFIIKNFRKNASNISLEKGDDVTFGEFVNYLISSNPDLYNEHWQRVTDLCHPCLVNYDFIGKYETLIEDSNFILKYLGLNISFPVLAKPSTTAPNLKKYYNTLGKSAIYKLYNIYQMDFRLFDYDLFNTTDWSNNS